MTVAGESPGHMSEEGPPAGSDYNQRRAQPVNQTHPRTSGMPEQFAKTQTRRPLRIKHGGAKAPPEHIGPPPQVATLNTLVAERYSTILPVIHEARRCLQ